MSDDSPQPVPQTEHPAHAIASARLPIAASLLATASVAAAFIGARWVFRSLDRIENSPAAYTAYSGPSFAYGLLAGAFAIAVCVFGWNHARRTFRRAARFTVWSLVATLLLWMAPTPFAIHRIALVAFVLIGAGFLAVAALAPVGDLLRRRAESDPVWLSPLIASGAFAAAASAMLVYKADALGWAQAID